MTKTEAIQRLREIDFHLRDEKYDSESWVRKNINGVIDAITQEKIISSNSHVSGSLLERAMLTLDDYLNAGCKKTRKQAAENAKFIYKKYYGVDYVNRNDR